MSLQRSLPKLIIRLVETPTKLSTWFFTMRCLCSVWALMADAADKDVFAGKDHPGQESVGVRCVRPGTGFVVGRMDNRPDNA